MLDEKSDVHLPRLTPKKRRFPVDSAEVLISLCRAENQISSSWLTVASAHEMLAKCWPEIDDLKRHPPSLKKTVKMGIGFSKSGFGVNCY